MGKLTKEQKEAIAWCDFVAGLATAELGPVSFAIGAAASIAYYKDKVANDDWPKIELKPGSIPSKSNNLGVLHNLTCEHYLVSEYPDVNFRDIIYTASKVRPDLTEELHNISEEYFIEKVEWAKAQKTSTTKEQLTLITGIISLQGEDTETVNNSLNNIKDVNEYMWIANIDDLIKKVASFELTEIVKDYFTNSLEILKLSYILWGE